MNPPEADQRPKGRRLGHRRREQGQRRRAEKPSSTCEPIEFVVPPTISSRDVHLVAIETLWKHLLYTRGIWPVRLPSGGSDRKSARANQAWVAMEDDWRDVSGIVAVDRVAILVGPSWQRPKEVYVVSMEQLECEDCKETTMTNWPYALSSRLARKMIQCDSTDVDHRSPSDRLWVALAIPQASWEVAHELLSPKVTWQRQGLPEQAKSIRRQVLVTLRRNESIPIHHDDLVWLSLKTSVPGFRLF